MRTVALRSPVLCVPAAVGACGLLLLAALPALAGTAETVSTPSASIEVLDLRYAASAGEANQVGITRSGQTYTVVDSAGVMAGSGCLQRDPKTAACDVLNETGIQINLGDRNDRLSFAGASPAGDGATVSDGRGDDTVHGTGSDDVLQNDRGDDALRGGAGDDELEPGSGNDRLSGGGGRDRLSGGGGKDRLSGGPGNDSINSADGVAETVTCGDGANDKVKADRNDRLRGCERIRRS